MARWRAVSAVQRRGWRSLRHRAAWAGPPARSRYRGDSEGPGDVRGHLAEFSGQPYCARPQLVGLPCGSFAHRLGLVGRLPPYLLGLSFSLAERLGLVGRLPPYLLGLPLSGFAYRVGLLPCLLLDPGSLLVSIGENPLRQPDRIRLESPSSRRTGSSSSAGVSPVSCMTSPKPALASAVLRAAWPPS